MAFLLPIMATFGAVGEAKEKPLVYCFVDGSGTWSTIIGISTVTRDWKKIYFPLLFISYG